MEFEEAGFKKRRSRMMNKWSGVSSSQAYSDLYIKYVDEKRTSKVFFKDSWISVISLDLDLRDRLQICHDGQGVL
jgi:hypothetical protein